MGWPVAEGAMPAICAADIGPEGSGAGAPVVAVLGAGAAAPVAAAGSCPGAEKKIGKGE